MSDIQPLRDMIAILPNTKRTGGTLDFRSLDDETLDTLDKRADEVIDDGLAGVHAIGEMLFWATRDESSAPDFTGGAGQALQILTQAIQAAREVQDGVGYVRYGLLKREGQS